MSEEITASHDQHHPSRRTILGAGLAAIGAAATGCARTQRPPGAPPQSAPDTVLFNGRITTLDPATPEAQAIAMADGRVLATGTDDDILPHVKPETITIDLRGRRVIPGLNDSHTHVIRGGLNYNMELRWDGVWSLADALEMLRIQAARTPAPQWVRVVGGWSEFQFKERRMPTVDEINAVSPDVPVFILNLYSSAILNRAALRALGYDRDTPEYDRGQIVRDTDGNPTGLLLARPSALILYKSLAMGPRLGIQDQINSTRHFMRDLNRLGITSIIDAGGGGQNYPEDYEVIQALRDRDEMTVRVAYDLFAQNPGTELDDFKRWTRMVRPGHGDDMLKLVGAGENLTWAAADFEIFTQPRPDLAGDMESQLEPIVRLLAEARWPFRIHATYDQSITRFLDVFERVNQEIPFQQPGRALHWFIDHAETISDRNIDRIAAMGGGIAVQHRMMFQGEHFLERYGAEQIARTPPLRNILDSGVPLGGGTDGTRVASYNPWISLAWMATGRTLGGLQMYTDDNILSREEALRVWTHGSAWFSSEQSHKGTLTPGAYADLAVLTHDYISCPDATIKDIESLLTVMDGTIVHAAGEFAPLAPPLPAASPDWSPVREFGGYGAPLYVARAARDLQTHTCAGHGHHGSSCGHHAHTHAPLVASAPGWTDGPAHPWDPGCACFAF
ncbi:MAG: amidohydrolase [Planctomycetota bacterium]